MTPEEGSARTAGKRQPGANRRFPAVPAGLVAPPGGRRGEGGRSGPPAAWGWATLAPSAASPAALPGVATTMYSSSVPEGGRTDFSPSLLFRGSWVAIPRAGLVDIWGSVCRIVLQTSSPTHNQIYTGRRPLPFVPYPQSPPMSLGLSQTHPQRWREPPSLLSSPTEPIPAQGNLPHEARRLGSGIWRGPFWGLSLKGQEVQGWALPPAF